MDIARPLKGSDLIRILELGYSLVKDVASTEELIESEYLYFNNDEIACKNLQVGDSIADKILDVVNNPDSWSIGPYVTELPSLRYEAVDTF